MSAALMRRRTFLFASLATAFAGASASTAEAEPDKITVFVAPRPGQATAVAGWSHDLQTAAQAAIDRAGHSLATGSTLANWIGENFGKHHIIPQALLQVAAGLAIEERAGSGALRQRFVKALTASAAGPAVTPGTTALNLGPVAWSQVNLFEGPTLFYRADDPGDGAELTRPKSFDEKRWTALQNARSVLESLGTMTDRKAKDGRDFSIPRKNLTDLQKGGKTGFETIVLAFEALAAVGGDPNHAAVQPFSANDWVDSGNRPINLGQLIGYKDNAIQAQIIQSKKNAYRLWKKT